MSNMKGGFSTLNRWLGKKNKDKNAAPNGKLSKSNANLASLSVSSTDITINEASQLEYNRITPLPAATSNAPFEQTFRITVLLPKDQLYVTRLGARIPLSKLLELVCENKQLHADKYEFRNPVDPSQVYGCELTIGAVGLSEVRLCHKSDSYDTFNTDEVIKLHRTAGGIRDSLSSSEFSSRNSKHTTKTASPYSSSNSLNSMDSTGMNYTRTPVTAPPALTAMAPPKMTAMPRKKRAAPRPPSQLVIPERAALPATATTATATVTSTTTTPVATMEAAATVPLQALPRKDFSVSTPNLASSTLLSCASADIDCNGNTQLSAAHIKESEADDRDEMSLVETHVEERNARNLGVYRGSVQNLLSMEATADMPPKLPEPSPRKRLIQFKKKSAPAPPTRSSSVYGEDTISLSSSLAPETPDTPETPETPPFDMKESPPTSLSRAPVPPPKPLHASTPLGEEAMPRDASKVKSKPPVAPPKPVPRQITTTLLNATGAVESPAAQPAANVTKVMLNRTPTPEPRSLSLSEPGEMTERALNGDAGDEDDNVSKQADSGIGEPVPSPIPDSLQSEGSAHECKSTFESSSDDDDMVRVYNFKLGKTLLQPVEEPATPLPPPSLHDLQAGSDASTPTTPTPLAPTPNTSETASWNYAIPISPPPNFADTARPAPDAFANVAAVAAPVSDSPITPKIKQRPVLDFEALAKEAQPRPHSVQAAQTAQTAQATPLPSPMDEIMDELSAIISERRMDSLIRRADDQRAIESAKPNTLSNFSIATISEQGGSASKQHESLPNGHDSASGDEEKLYRKRGDSTPAATTVMRKAPSPPHKSRPAVARADSFHTTAQQSPGAASKRSPTAEELGGVLSARCSSHLSLTKIEQNGLGGLNRRRSSSELSIGESPSLQSLEVMKTILSSRKNSLANSSDGETKPASVEFVNRLEARRSSREDMIVATAELQQAPQKSKPPRADSVDGARERTEHAAQTPPPTQPKPKSEPQPQSQRPEPTLKPERPAPAQPLEVSKVYRYSGPPNINLSTWSERPKVQVAIKNEGDYIFGGKNVAPSRQQQPTAAATNGAASARSLFAAIVKSAPPPPNYRTSTPAGSLKWEPNRSEEVVAQPPVTPPAVAPKPLMSPTQRMGIPNEVFRVPITVKPLADVIIGPDEQGQENTQAAGKPRPTTHATPTAGSTATLPRSGANRFSMPAAASPGPSLLRSTSITQLEANRPKSTVGAQAAEVPFGQNTLRKTGLKEKILAKQADEEQQRNAHTFTSMPSAALNGPAVASQSTLHNGNTTAASSASLPAKSLKSAKLELKLQLASSVFTNSSGSWTAKHTPNTPDSSAAPSPPLTPVRPTLKPVSRAPPTPTKPVRGGGDLRCQLMAEVRNFKRGELNRL